MSRAIREDLALPDGWHRVGPRHAKHKGCTEVYIREGHVVIENNDCAVHSVDDLALYYETVEADVDVVRAVILAGYGQR